MNKTIVAAIVLSAFTLTGCGAMSTAVKKRNLEVKTQMSETVWLEPSNEKTVFIQVRNTSDKDMSNLQTLISNDLTAKGYKVSSSPDSAYYWVQANVLKADKMDLRQAQGFLSTGYEGAAAGAALGAVNYTMVTDLQISERTNAKVTTDNVAALKQGTSGLKVQTSSEEGNRHKYQTRIVSNANKVNLKFEEAKPVLEAQLAKSVAGIM